MGRRIQPNPSFFILHFPLLPMPHTGGRPYRLCSKHNIWSSLQVKLFCKEKQNAPPAQRSLPPCHTQGGRLSLTKKLRFSVKLPTNRACGPVRRARRGVILNEKGVHHPFFKLFPRTFLLPLCLFRQSEPPALPYAGREASFAVHRVCVIPTREMKARPPLRRRPHCEAPARRRDAWRHRRQTSGPDPYGRPAGGFFRLCTAAACLWQAPRA